MKVFGALFTAVFAADVLDIKRYLSIPRRFETEFFVVNGLTGTCFTYSKSAF